MATRFKIAPTPNRPELVAAHGYDTMYAMHALRLGLQGIELLRDCWPLATSLCPDSQNRWATNPGAATTRHRDG